MNAIANMAYVDWKDKSKFSNAAPWEYWPTLSEQMDPQRLKKQIYWHALPIGWEQLSYQDFLERRRSLIAGVVQEAFEQLWRNSKTAEKLSIEEKISSGESQYLEFKTTVLRNRKTGEADPMKLHIAVKAVCGFLNATGGSLLIGVGDHGGIVGIEDDMTALGKGNEDAYELRLRQALDNALSAPTAATVKITFHRVEGRTVCELVVAPSGYPVFANSPKGEGSRVPQFWVRIGNATKQLHGEDMVKYQKSHWG